MTDKIIVITTIDKEELAETIASALVERRLAACVNVFPLTASIYRWKEKICRDREFMLFIKTSAHLFNDVRNAIKELHTYDLPEVIALPIAAGEENVLAWIADSVNPLIR